MRLKNYKSSLRTLTILALFASCGKPPTNQVRVILKPTQELYLITSNIIDCINDAAGAELAVLGVGVNAVPVLYEDNEDPNVCGTWSRKCSATGTIKLDRECETGLVLVHEIGHSMGLGHNVDNPDDIMFPNVTLLNMTQACHSLAAHFDQ